MTEARVPQLVAHRGYMQCFPENTWPALEAALRAGARWLECDVQMCDDGEFVLLHDDSFARTAGVELSVFAVDSRDIAVSVHEPGRFGDRYAPTPVARLADVLRHITAWPDARIMVEIKQESIDHHGLDTVMEKLLPRLASCPQSVLISYNREALEWARRHSSIAVGWVLHEYNSTFHHRALTLAPDYLICNERKLDNTDPPWPGPWRWMLYDIVDPERALAWAARGVELIETRDIGALMRDARLNPSGIGNAAV
jgi:glycerophosphoryl diester phosphodiesterase